MKENANQAIRAALFTVFLMIVAGWIMLLDTGLVFEGQQNHAHFSNLVLTRLAGSFVGALLMIGAWLLPARVIRKLTIPALFTALVLLMMIWTRYGVAERGSTRWIEIAGIRFQPLEFAKLAIVWFLADQFARTGLLSKVKADRLWFPAVVAILIIGLVAAQPNISGAVFLIGIVFAMAWLAGINWKVTVGLAVAGTAAFAGLLALHPEKIARLMPVFRPLSDLGGSGYQVGLSQWAITTGGLFGKGPGNSIAMYSLPDHSTDFIFSIICEEWGFVGGFLVIMAFAILVFSGFRLALTQKDRFRLLFGCGVITIIGLQATINIGVTLGLLPTTGMPLPFLSAGGSNLLLSLLEIGLLLNLGRTAGVEVEAAKPEPSVTKETRKLSRRFESIRGGKVTHKQPELTRNAVKRRMAR